MVAEESGQFIIKYADQQESNPVTIFSAATAIISGAAKASPTGATLDAIPNIGGSIQGNPKCKGRILVYFESAATDIIESEESQWEIPVVVLNESGNPVSKKTLTQENMTGFTQAGTVDVTCTVGIPQRIAYFDVPRGLVYALDPQGKVRCFMGDNS